MHSLTVDSSADETGKIQERGSSKGYSGQWNPTIEAVKIRDTTGLSYCGTENTAMTLTALRLLSWRPGSEQVIEPVIRAASRYPRHKSQQCV